MSFNGPEEIFMEIGIIIILAVLLSGLMKKLNQPLIIGYIMTGIVLRLLPIYDMEAADTLELLSRFGISFLLFIGGISLNPRDFRTVGRASVITGLGQVVFTFIIGFTVSKILGFSNIAAMYMSIALMFSSTIIIMRLLLEKGDLHSLYGRISVGFLIVQDIVAIVILIAISFYTTGFDLSGISPGTAIIGTGLITLIAFFSIFGLGRMTRTMARSGEFLLLVSIGWLFLMIMSFQFLGLPIEIGALLAGMFMSTLPHSYEIRLRMNVLSDFFIIFFFVFLGTQMVMGISTTYLLPIVIFSLIILIGNPLIVMSLMGSMKYSRRNGFMAGLTVAQISEFSLIVIALGIRVGHIPNEILSIMTAVALITILVCTYLFTNANRLYPAVSDHLKVFERGGVRIDEKIDHRKHHNHIIMFGYGRIGYDIAESIVAMKRKYLIIDHDPEVIALLKKGGYRCGYGDANDIELLGGLALSAVKMIVSVIPDFQTNQFLVRTMRSQNKDAIIIVVAHRIDETLALYSEGTTYVIMPYFLGGHYASSLIKRFGLDADSFGQQRLRQITKLRIRSRLGHTDGEFEGLE